MKLSISIATSALFALSASTSVAAAPSSAIGKRQSSTSQGYYNPYSNGGSMLTGATASGLGEPINVIVSGNSDSGVLSQAGFEEFSRSIYFSPGSCFSITEGTPQTANLGDGNGAKDQTNLMRYNMKQGDGGTCLESLYGGNHFRYWIQNGSAADSGAIFMAASVELNSTLNHDIAPNGYNLGRNWLVGNATAGTLTSPGGFQYTVTEENNAQLLSGISASQINHDISIDGVVSVLTVTITKNGTIGANRDSSSAGTTSSTPQQQSAAFTAHLADRKLLLMASIAATAITTGIATILCV